MNNDDSLIALVDTAADIFKIDRNELSLSTRKGEVKEWDSLAHVILLLAIEERFDVRFSTTQIKELDSLSAIFDEISLRKAG